MTCLLFSIPNAICISSHRNVQHCIPSILRKRVLHGRHFATTFSRQNFRKMFSCNMQNIAFSEPSSESQVGSQNVEKNNKLDLSFPAFMVWGANTGVGKTLVSAGLVLNALISKKNMINGEESTSFPQNPNVIYVKPIQTGFPEDSDARFVSEAVSKIAISKNIYPKTDADHSNSQPYHPIQSQVATWQDSVAFNNHSRFESYMSWGWREAVSPHLAAEREGGMPLDEEILDNVRRRLCPDLQKVSNLEYKNEISFAVVETAGGVASPSPSGSLQCDVYRRLRLPCVLVGDGRLGGISSTITAYESLNIRGYDTVAIILIDHGYDNHSALNKHFNNEVPVLVLPELPRLQEPLTEHWFKKSEPAFEQLYEKCVSFHQNRLKIFTKMTKEASDIFWWPFTQHGLINEHQISIIDSRYGSDFAVIKKENAGGISEVAEKDKNAEKDKKFVMDYQFDACASWWTQGPNQKFQQKLAQVAGYACGRYGHVMFPENVYSPALDCAKLLINGPGKGWSSRCFFSDNGSTAIEVALKMAFRFFLDRNKYLPHSSSSSSSSSSRYDNDEIPLFESSDFQVIALSGSYHGDTLGAMEAQSPSSYTGILQQPWYKGRGLFLPSPSLHFKNGVWKVQIPNSIFDSSSSSSFSNLNQELIFKKRDDIFDLVRDDSEICKIYENFIINEISKSKKINAALIIEPVIHGAGGMVFIDPLFQRTLVKKCKSLQIPVIFDEIFTGCWRLGVESTSQLLGCFPDIACYAKLLTCGVLPMAATLASNDVFQSFYSKSKLESLLHGHSYTAHAVGCSVAKASLEYYKDLNYNQNYDPIHNKLHEFWDEEIVLKISNLPNVERVIYLGTLFAVELCTDDAGYASSAAKELVSKLKNENIFSRPLGNVVYVMCGPMTHKTQCSEVLSKLYKLL